MRGYVKVLIGVAIAAGVVLGVIGWGRVLTKPATSWVNPVDAHNEAIEQVPIEDRAYPHLARFYARYSQLDIPDTFDEADPGDEGWDAVQAWISTQAVQGLIDELEAASECSVLGVPLYDYEDPIWVREMQGVGYWSDVREVERSGGQVLLTDCLLPMPGVIVQAGHVLYNDAQTALVKGDMNRLMRDVRIWSRLVLFADEPEVLISQLVQLAESWKIGRLIGEQLYRYPHLITEEMAGEFESIFMEFADSGMFVIDFELENMMFEDIIRRMVDDDGAADYVQIRDFVPALGDGDAGILPPASRARLEDIEPELLTTYNHFVDRGEVRVNATEMPWQTIRVLDDEETWSDRFTTPAGEIGKVMFPVLSIADEKLDNAVSMFRSSMQYLIGVRVAVAAHRHLLRHGEPAMELSDIDDDLLAFDPMDGFTGKPVQYRWIDGHALVYAVGADGDDDGGKRLETPDQSSGFVVITDAYLAEPGDEDMVLFPFLD